MIKKIKVGLVLTLSLYSTTVFSQYAFAMQYFGGRMVPHSSYTKLLASEIYGCQTDVVWKLRIEHDELKGKKNEVVWTPQIGASITWMNMGLAVTGYQLGASLNLGGEFSNKGPWSLSYHFAHGLTYLSEKYDSNSVPINYAIGSTINYFAQLKMGVKYDISNNLSASIGAYLTHASNGNWEKPNVGLNALHYGIGVVYYPNESKNTDRSSYYQNKKHFFTFPYSIGLKMAIRSHTLEYPESFTVWIGDIQFRIQRNARHVWDLGFDLFVDPNYKFTKLGRYTGANELDQLEFAIKGGHQFVFGRVSLRTDIGVYVYKPIASDKGAFYNAIGIDYRLSQNWVLRSRLKAHLNIADYMEFGISRVF